MVEPADIRTFPLPHHGTLTAPVGPEGWQNKDERGFPLGFLNNETVLPTTASGAQRRSRTLLGRSPAGREPDREVDHGEERDDETAVRLSR